MRVKMIQNLENKMELQVNRLETSIEKIQKMFNKDLGEKKKKKQGCSETKILIHWWEYNKMV